jgi:hypothetical protein
MRFKKPRTRIARILAAAVCVLGIAAPVSAVVPATAAQAKVCTPSYSDGEYSLARGCPATEIDAAHTCAYISNTAVNGVKAIECADVWASNENTAGQGDIWGEGVFYCQGPNGYVQCGGMNVNVGLAYSEAPIGVGYSKPPRNYKCNPSPGPACSTSQVEVASEHLVYPDSCWQVYASLPAINIVAINGTALYSRAELRSNTVRVCIG